MSELSEILFAVHDSLQKANIPHAVGGAIALGYCTLDPRGTRDVDFNVFVETDRAREVLAVLPDNVAVDSERLERLERDGQVRLRSGATPVDLFLNVLPFHEHVERHIRLVPFEGRTIPILSCTALVVFKAMFDRTQDWADIEAMVEARSFDPEEAGDWIRQMLGEDRRVERIAAAIERRRSGAEPRPLRLRPDGKVEVP
jgi:hypothetical protein